MSDLTRAQKIEFIARLHVKCVILAGNSMYHGHITKQINDLRAEYDFGERHVGDEIIDCAEEIISNILKRLDDPNSFV